MRCVVGEDEFDPRPVFCWMLNAYDGGAGACSSGDVAICGATDTPLVAAPAKGAVAVCSTGFCTCVDLTDCIMIGGCVFVCLAPHTDKGIGRGIGDRPGGVGCCCPLTVIGLGEPVVEVAE